MTRKVLIIIGIFSVTFALTGLKTQHLSGQVQEQNRYQSFVTYLVDPFNNPGSWIVKFSRFRAHNWDTNSANFQDSQAFLRWKTVREEQFPSIMQIELFDNEILSKIYDNRKKNTVLAAYEKDNVKNIYKLKEGLSEQQKEEIRDIINRAGYFPNVIALLPPYSIDQQESLRRHGVMSDTIPGYLLGVRAKFVVNGYNWVVLEPKEPLYFKGLLKAVYFWLWGGNYKYKSV